MKVVTIEDLRRPDGTTVPLRRWVEQIPPDAYIDTRATDVAVVESAAVVETALGGKYYCQAVRLTGQSVPNDTPTIITFPNENFDVGDLHGSDEFITIPSASGIGGIWILSGYVEFDGLSDTNGTYAVWITRSDELLIAQQIITQAAGGAFPARIQVLAFDFDPPAGRTYRLTVRHTQGGTASVLGHFTAVRKSW